MPKYGLFKAKSKIPNAGNGVFTADHIPAGTVLFASFTWVGTRSKQFEVDYEQSHWNRSLNHSEKPNLESFWNSGQTIMYKRTIRDILAGEELTSDYMQTEAIIPAGYTFNSFLNF